MASTYRLPNRAKWIQEDMQQTLNQMLGLQQSITDTSQELAHHVQTNYSNDTTLLSLITDLVLHHQQLNIQTSLLQQMNHDLRSGDYKERNEDGHTIQSTS